MSQITLKQLAEMTNLSIRTVSRALKNDPSVVETKRRTVLELAARLHYTPNMAARNLRLQCSHFVGIVSGDITQEIFVQKLSNLESKLKAAGYYPLLGKAGESAAELDKMLLEWSGIVNDVVFISAGADLFGKCVMRNSPVNFIFVDQAPSPIGHNLAIDRAVGICEAVLHLIRSGRKHLLRCGATPSRNAGVEMAFRAVGPAERPEYLQIDSQTEFADGYRLGSEVIRCGADGVFFDTDRMAMGFLKYACEHRIDVPGRVAVVGFDDEPAGRMASPSLSTVAHPIEEINDQVMDIIGGKVAGGYISKSFATRFIQRQSA